MANYVCYFRTNYFKVKDAESFEEWAALWQGDLNHATKVGEDGVKWHMLYTYDGETGLPQFRRMSRAEAKDYVTNNPVLFPMSEYESDEDAIEAAMDDPWDVPKPEGTYSDGEADFYAELAEHLTDDCVAQGTEIGHEKIRYLTGVTALVDSTGNVEFISLDHWASEKAKELFPGKVRTDNSY